MSDREPSQPSTDEDLARHGFEILSDELRLEILQALSTRLREVPDDPAIGFADLRRAVGQPDSGNFNYHLDQLEGRFVRKTDAGYQITAAGMRVVAAVLVGAYGGGEAFGPMELDDECPVCKEPLTARYADGLLTVDCSNDHEFRNPLPPGAIDERDLEEVIDLHTLRIHQTLESAVEGICPFCYAQLSWAVDPDFDPAFPEFHNQCSRCGVRVDVPIIAALLQHPAVIGFYHDNGIDPRKRPPWAAEFYTPVQVGVEGTDPLQLRVSVRLDDDTLEATVGSDLTVGEVMRPPD